MCLVVRVINEHVYLIHPAGREYPRKPADQSLMKPATEAPMFLEPWKHSLHKLESNRQEPSQDLNCYLDFSLPMVPLVCTKALLQQRYSTAA